MITPTMIVYIDGEPHERFVVNWEPEDGPFGFMKPLLKTRPVPQTSSDEVVLWTLGGKCHIGKTYT